MQEQILTTDGPKTLIRLGPTESAMVRIATPDENEEIGLPPLMYRHVFEITCADGSKVVCSATEHEIGGLDSPGSDPVQDSTSSRPTVGARA